MTEKKKINKLVYLGFIPFLGILVLLNYDFVKKIITKKEISTNVENYKGIIKDSVYYNEYLDWTFTIPTGYNLIPENDLQKKQEKGSKYFDQSSNDKNSQIRLLNISNGLIDFTSNLNPKVYFPNITTEDKYIQLIEENYKNISVENLKLEKQNQGTIMIDSIEFKYIEYFAIGPERKVGMMTMTKLNDDFILDFNILYTDTQEAIDFINRLKSSEFNWK